METYERILDVLGDGTRRQIFERVADAPASVRDLAMNLPVTRPAVSQHLRALKDAGLLTVRAEGTRRIYSVDPSGLAQLHAYVERFWNRALASFKEVAEGED